MKPLNCGCYIINRRKSLDAQTPLDFSFSYTWDKKGWDFSVAACLSHPRNMLSQTVNHCYISKLRKYFYHICSEAAAAFISTLWKQKTKCVQIFRTFTVFLFCPKSTRIWTTSDWYPRCQVSLKLTLSGVVKWTCFSVNNWLQKTNAQKWLLTEIC